MRSLTQRGPAGLVMALALIHHLAISNNTRFERLARFSRIPGVRAAHRVRTGGRPDGAASAGNAESHVSLVHAAADLKQRSAGVSEIRAVGSDHQLASVGCILMSARYSVTVYPASRDRYRQDSSQLAHDTCAYACLRSIRTARGSPQLQARMSNGTGGRGRAGGSVTLISEPQGSSNRSDVVRQARQSVEAVSGSSAALSSGSTGRSDRFRNGVEVAAQAASFAYPGLVWLPGM